MPQLAVLGPSGLRSAVFPQGVLARAGRHVAELLKPP